VRARTSWRRSAWSDTGRAIIRFSHQQEIADVPDAYCKRLTSLNLTQEQAGELFGASARNGQQWAAEGPPLPVAIVLLLVGNDRAKLDRVADKLAIKWRARWSNL